MTDSNVHLVKSAQRVLEVIEYFHEDRPVATVTDISRALSYPQSSTSVLLRCLRQLGYLYYDRSSRTYRLTARAGLLGCWAEDGNYRGGKVMRLMDTVAERLGESVLLSSNGADYAAHHLHAVRGAAPGAVFLRAGGVEPLLSSVQGELILASYPDPQIPLALRRLNAEESDPARRVNIDGKLAEMQAMRERGWNLRCDPGAGGGEAPFEPGMLAVLLPRRKGRDRIALSVVADARRMARGWEEMLAVIVEERDRLFEDAPARGSAARRVPASAFQAQVRPELDEGLSTKDGWLLQALQEAG